MIDMMNWYVECPVLAFGEANSYGKKRCQRFFNISVVYRWYESGTFLPFRAL